MEEEDMNDYLAVYMIDDVSIGDRFTLWPLHMTILPWFSAPKNQAVLQAFGHAVEGFSSFQVTIGERGYFGINNDIPVMRVKNTPVLQDLHAKLLNVVISEGWQMNGRYTGKNYKPHITRQNGRDVDPSNKLSVDSLHIVERLPQGYRQIIGKVALK